MSIAEIDLRAGRARGAECEAAELQARRGRSRALLDEIESKVLCFLVALLFFEHLQSIDDGPGRTDQIVTDAGAEKGCKIERIKSNRRGHKNVSGGRFRENARLTKCAVAARMYTVDVRPAK